MQTLRNYKTKDVDMLISAGAILENAIANKVFLQSKRNTWADPFFDDLKARLDNAAQNVLGIDSAKDMRQATATLLEIQSLAIRDLAEAKVQILEDFKNNKSRRDEVLKQLGFAGYLAGTQKRDQEALINLLYQFKTNLTRPLRNEIISAGTAAAALETIIGYADTLLSSNVSQETFKSNKRVLTVAAVKEFNGIYDTVISIAKIAAKFYKDDPAMKAQFNFSKVSKTLNVRPVKPKPVAPTA